MKNNYSIAKLGRRALLILALTAYSLLFSEIFVRVVRPQPLLPRYVTGTPWGVRGNIPNAVYWHRTPEVEVQYRINSQGLRADHDYALQKTPGSCRVALFGDSFFVGFELDLKETFASRLEERLRADGIDADVLNFSVSGFGTAEMIRTYEGYARKFHPDVVIFEWHFTDPDDNVRSGLYAYSAGRLAVRNRTYLPAVEMQDELMSSTAYRFVADNSHFYSLVRETIGVKAKRSMRWLRKAKTKQLVAAPVSRVDASAPAVAGQSPVAYDKVLSGELLKYANDTVKAEGHDFLLIDVPTRQNRTTFQSPVSLIPQSAREHLEILDPVEAFRRAARPDRKLYYEQGHGHFTPTGVHVLLDSVIAPIEASPAFSTCRHVTSARLVL